jgi:signal transduction histidine kinase
MTPGSRQKRVLLLFLLGIVVPSLLLGYLAFRGIQNDQALLEQNRIEAQRRAADLITRAVADAVKKTEEALLAELPDRQGGSDPTLAARLARFTGAHPLVEGVFAWRGPNTVRFPAAGLVFLPPAGTAFVRPESQPSPAADRARAAERLEFGHQDFPAALAGYRLALDRATGVQAQAELAGAIARVQKKAGRFPDAIASYRSIAQTFDQVRSASGIPMGLAARLELASLYATTGDPARSLQAYVDLYASLVSGAWTLEEAQYDFCAQQIRDGVDGVLPRVRDDPQAGPGQRRFTALKEEEKKQKAAARRLLPFSAGAARSIEAQLRSNPRAAAGAFTRFALDTGGQSFLVCLQVRSAPDGAETTEAWGLLINRASLADVLRRLLIANASSEDTAWIVRGADDQVILASERAPSGAFAVSARFEEEFPNWSLEFFQPSPRRLTTLLGARQGIYLYMFVLIAGILVFGLALTVRTLSHEMELARLKSDFVSTVSHEFKSPLTSIQQVAEMLQAGRVPSEERRQQYYDLLMEQSRRLCLLTDNILSLARIEEGRTQFVFERLDVAALLREIVPAVQDRVRHDGFAIELKVERPLPEIVADGNALAQAVTNLLDNAVKYSGPSRSIIVRSFIQEGHLAISVRDFGVGIRTDEAGRVFDRFYRGGDELTRSVKGSGLGLTLVKEIVEAHRGTVKVESAPGQGSTFTILLPFEEKRFGTRGRKPRGGFRTWRESWSWKTRSPS